MSELVFPLARPLARAGVFGVASGGAVSLLSSQRKAAQILNEGTSGKKFRVLIVGDSNTEGSTASTKPNRYVEKLAEKLRASLGFPSKPNSKYVSANYLVQTEDFVFGGTNTPGTNFGLGMRANSLGAGGTATLSFTGTGIDLMLLSAFSTGAGTYAVDGGAPVAINTDLGAASSDMRMFTQVVQVRGLTPGAHSIVITATDSLILEGAYVFDGDESEGVEVYEAGHPGWRFADFKNLYVFSSNNQVHALTLNPDLVVIALGANDYLQAASIAIANNDFRQLVHLLRATNPTVSILYCFPHEVTDGAVSADAFATWRSTLRATCAALGVAFLDWGDAVGSFVPGGNANDSGDQIHPNNAGHELIAQQLSSALTAVDPAASFPAYVDPPDLLNGTDLTTWATSLTPIVTAASTLDDGTSTYTVQDDNTSGTEGIKKALPTLLANAVYRLTIHARARNFTTAGGNTGPVLQVWDEGSNLIQVFHTIQTLITARQAGGSSAAMGLNQETFAAGLRISQIDPDFVEMFVEFQVGGADKSGLFAYLYPTAGAINRTGTLEFGKPRLQRIG